MYIYVHHSCIYMGWFSLMKWNSFFSFIFYLSCYQMPADLIRILFNPFYDAYVVLFCQNSISPPMWFDSSPTSFVSSPQNSVCLLTILVRSAWLLLLICSSYNAVLAHRRDPTPDSHRHSVLAMPPRSLTRPPLPLHARPVTKIPHQTTAATLCSPCRCNPALAHTPTSHCPISEEDLAHPLIATVQPSSNGLFL